MKLTKWMPLIILLGAFLILTLVYMQATPPFEASDELWHFGMVDYIADNWQLPVQNPDVETPYRQEGSQPPLYYILSALLVSGLDRDDLESRFDYNPHALVGVPGASHNKNIVLHVGEFDDGQTLTAVYLLRGFSIVLGLITITAIYQTALELGNMRYAVLATALAALNPMFLFITASVNNDNLVTMLNSVIIWQLVVMGRKGFQTRRSILLAVLLALATLSKISGLVLMPVVLFATLYLSQRDQNQRGFVVLWVSIVTAWALLAGWWYLRNIMLYGELFGTEMMVQVAGPRIEPFTPLTLIQEFEGFRISYWALFGGVNVMAWPIFYMLMDLLTLTGLLGLALALNQMLPYIVHDMSRYHRLFVVRDFLNLHWLYAAAIFSMSVVLGFVGIASWTAQTYASQGRLLFPFILSISLLLATGLRYIWRKQERYWTWGTVGLFAVVAIVMPFAVIQPAYAPPAIVDTIGEDVTPVYARYDDIELVGYHLPNRRYEVGQRVPVTVYWRVLEQSEQDLSLYLTLLRADGTVVGKVDTYPGGGTLRTTHWQTGQVYKDTYSIELNQSAFGRSDMRLLVGWWHYPTENVVPATDETGQSLSSVMLDAGGFVGESMVSLDHFSPIRPVTFGNEIALLGINQPRGDVYQLAWRANQRIDENYVVFFQMIDERTGAIVAQGDTPPALSTQYWRRGDTIITEHVVRGDEPLTSGHYRILVGWYHPQTGERLALPNDEDNAYLLTRFSFP